MPNKFPSESPSPGLATRIRLNKQTIRYGRLSSCPDESGDRKVNLPEMILRDNLIATKTSLMGYIMGTRILVTLNSGREQR